MSDPQFCGRGRKVGAMPRAARKPIVGLFAVLLALLLFPTQPAAAQQGTPVVPSVTPRQVLDGSAQFIGPVDENQMLRLVIALNPPNLAAEEKFIKSLTTKGSPSFHKFLSPEEWNERFAPSVSDEQAVLNWAQKNGLTVSNRYANRLLVDVEAPVGKIQQALGVKINQYQLNNKSYFSNDREPVIPGELSNIVVSIAGLNNIRVLRPTSHNVPEQNFPMYKAGPAVSQPLTEGKDADGNSVVAMRAKLSAKSQKLKPNITNGYYDPTDLYSSEAYDTNALYNQGHCCNPTNNSGGTPNTTSIAIATAGSQDTNDFIGFHNQYPYLAMHWFLVGIDGETVPCDPSTTTCDLEGTMDFEWSTAMSNSFGSLDNTSSVVMYDGVNSGLGTFEDIYNRILSDNGTRVMSTSWGCEELSCFDAGDITTTHNIFLNMVGEGWTLIAASGDQGASAGCGNATAVQYPSSDPLVVAAGGTTLELFEGPVYDSETGWQGGSFSGACGENDGGSTGGFSSVWGAPSYQSSLGFSNRAVPDIALNASVGQNIYYGGSLFGEGGTSIVAPEMAGFFAQENAYLLGLNDCGNGVCAPIGQGNPPLYTPFDEIHYPFYDITSGCNSNDITAFYGLGYYCAGAGYDEVTGLGSLNMLQLAWDMNYYAAGFPGGTPGVSITGPAVNTWYNTDQAVSWNIIDNSTDQFGIAGFTQGWDSIPTDPYSEPTPGSGNSFYSGPQYPNGTAGCLSLNGGFGCAGGVSQGCHTAYVQGWDNSGYSGGAVTYGPICYDTIAPTTSASLSGTVSGSVYISGVKVTLSATDSGSGVKATYASVDGGGYFTYSSPFSISTTGNHSVSFYSVDVAGNFNSVQTVSFTIESPTSTALAVSSNHITYGQSEVLTATVSASFGGAPGGNVQFLVGASVIGTSAISGGKATLSTSALNSGNNSITAHFVGTGNDVASSSTAVTVSVVADGTSTTLASSKNPAPYDSPVSFTATVKPTTSGTPTGTITFKSGTSTLGSVALSGGKATYTTNSLALGSHSITAVYGGSTDYLTSTSSALSETIQDASTTTTVVSSLNPSIYHKAVLFTATVKPSTAGTPTGTVTFKDGTTTLGTATLSGGKAAFSDSNLTVGSHSITAVYDGSTDYLASTSSTLKQTVEAEPTTTTVVSSANPSVYSKAVTFTATVKSGTADVPTGTVTFKNGATVLGTGTLSAGEAKLTISTLPAGSDSITADYAGSTDFAASVSAAFKETVTQAATSTVVKSSVNPSTSGQTVTFSVNVTSADGTPTGTVSFSDGVGTVNLTLSGGKASYTTNALPAGNHTIQATYKGSTDFATSKSAAFTQTVKP